MGAEAKGQGGAPPPDAPLIPVATATPSSDVSCVPPPVAPVVEAPVKATLPEWTNKKPDWRREVRPTMTIDGKVNSGPVTFRGIRVELSLIHI